jgi:tetratricopeptide (TPR) repeat protein
MSAVGIQARNEGLRLLTHERVGPAIEAFERAVADDPDDATAYAFLAAARFAGSEPDAAEVAIARSLELDPEGYWPNLKAGELRLRLGADDDAKAHFLRALRAVEPGTRESEAAARALARTRTSVARSISHRAVLPSWLARSFGRDRTVSGDPGEA